MTIADEKEKLSTRRRQLIRISVGLHISGELVDQGGNLYLYTADAPFAFAGITLNGSASGLTEVSSPSSNGEYAVDEDAQTILIYSTAGTPNETTVNWVFERYLFFSTDETVYLPEDPYNETGATREWRPLISTAAEPSEDLSNNLAGIVTYGTCSFSLISENAELHEIFVDLASVYKRPVKIWNGLNDIYQPVFSGRLQSPSIARSRIDFNAYDQLALLDQTALFGDNADQILSPLPSPSGDQQVPLPLIIGPSSYYKTHQLTQLTAQPTSGLHTLTAGNQAFVVSYSSTVSTTTNRAWRACRFGGVVTQSFGSITRVLGSLNYKYVKFASFSNLYPGDTISWVEAGPQYGIIIYAGADFTQGGLTYNVVIWNPTGPGSPNITTSSTMVDLISIGVGITGGTMDTNGYAQPVFYSRDFTVSVGSFDNNDFLQITFVNNFEAAWSPTLQTLDPAIHQVHFRVSNAPLTDFKHGTIISEICESLGLDVNNASVTTANTSLTDECYFQVPFFGETTNPTYRDIIEKILASSFGYLRNRPDLDQLEYVLLAAPSGTDTANESLFEAGDPAISLSYDDIVGILSLTNRHLVTGTSAVGTTVVTSQKQFVNALHSIVRTYDLEHVLGPTNSIGSRTRIIGARSQRLVKYRLSTATANIDNYVGDDIIFDDETVLGGDTPKSLKILGIKRSLDKTEIVASDLLGLT